MIRRVLASVLSLAALIILERLPFGALYLVLWAWYIATLPDFDQLFGDFL